MGVTSIDAVHNFLARVAADGELDWNDMWTSASRMIGTDRIQDDEYDAWTARIDEKIATGQVVWGDGGQQAYRALRQR
ncbi:MAG: hypothetical protein AAFQ82_18265, partial [Myxococcota bacterium]